MLSRGPALLVLAALAFPARAAPPPALTVSVEPATLVDRFAQRAAAAGVVGPAAVALCKGLAPDLVICLRRSDGAGQDLLTLAELPALGMDEETAWAQVRTRVEAAWTAAPPQRLAVPGMEGQYLLRAVGDGMDCAGLLLPQRLAELAGGSPVVACPAVGALLFWVPALGAPSDFDTVVAVGVRRTAEAAAAPRSARLLRWDAGEWTVWGEVTGSLAPRSPGAPAPR